MLDALQRNIRHGYQQTFRNQRHGAAQRLPHHNRLNYPTPNRYLRGMLRNGVPGLESAPLSYRGDCAWGGCGLALYVSWQLIQVNDVSLLLPPLSDRYECFLPWHQSALNDSVEYSTRLLGPDLDVRPMDMRIL